MSGNENITHFISPNYDDSNSSSGTQDIQLRKYPSDTSSTIATLSVSEENYIYVYLIKEWATGNSKWAKILIADPESAAFRAEGYMLTKYLKPVGGLVSSSSILEKSNIFMERMSPMALALIPDWYRLEKPYYHRENGEYWINVQLSDTCLFAGEEYEQQKKKAKTHGTQELFKYLSIPYDHDQSIVDNFVNGFRSGEVKDFYLSSRPNSKLRMLVVIPAIYTQYLKENLIAPPKEDEFGTDVLSWSEYEIRIPFKMYDTYRIKVRNCLKRFYESYNKSNFKIKGFDFENEIKSVDDAFIKIKSLLIDNNVNTSGTTKDGEIVVRFDAEYRLYSIHFTDPSVGSHILDVGFDYVKNSHPFDSKRTSYIFLRQNEFCNPELTLKIFLNKYIVDPAPVIKFKDISLGSMSGPKIGDFGSLELGMSLDLESILNDISLNFNNGLNLNTNLDFGSFNYGNSNLGGNSSFKLEAIKFRDMNNINIGDPFSSKDFLSSLTWKLGFGDLGDLYNLALKFIDINKLFGIISSYYASSSSLSLGDLSSPSFGDFDLNFPKTGESGDFNFPPGGSLDFDLGSGKSMGDFSLGAPDSSFDFDFEIPSTYLDLPSFDLLSNLGDLLFEIFERILAQIILQVLIYLLESLIAQINGSICSPDLGSPNASIDSAIVRDYGGENFNDLLQDSIGVYEDDVYNSRINQIYIACASSILPKVYSENTDQLEEIEAPSNLAKYFDSVSLMVSPVEMLALFNGKTPEPLLREILDYTQTQYEEIGFLFNTTDKIKKLFACMGENISSGTIEKVEEDISDMYKNPELCIDIIKELQNQLKDKCVTDQAVNSIYQKEVSSKADKYKKIINILSNAKNDNLLVPNLFNQDSNGTKGLLSSKGSYGNAAKPKNQDFIVDRMVETVIGAPRDQLQADAAGSSEIPNSSFYDKIKNTDNFKNLIISFSPPFNTFLVTKLGLANLSGRNFRINPQVDYDISPVYYVNKNGSSKITNLYANNDLIQTENSEGISFPAHGLSGEVQALITNSVKGNSLKNTTNIIKPEILFYELIQEYYKQNVESSSEIVPYYVSKNTESDPSDGSYPIILQSYIEKIATSYTEEYNNSSEYGFVLDQYYSNVSSNTSQIIDYERAKEIISSNWDLADFDNPNDDSVLGKKQLAILWGECFIFARVLILEYFLRSLFFSINYKLEKLDGDFTSFSVEYTKQVLISSTSSAEYQQIVDLYNQVYEFLKTKSETKIEGYSGATAGLDYFLYNNFVDVQEKVYEAAQISQTQINQINKDTILMAQDMPIIPVHSYAGVYVKDSLNTGTPENPSEKDYSLFKDSRYDKFKNGSMFLQKFFYIEDYDQETIKYPKVLDRPIEWKGVLNSDKFIQWLSVQADIEPDIKMSEFFKNVFIGSRLCYGITVDPSKSLEDAVDQEVSDLAKQIFQEYAPLVNTGQLDLTNSSFLNTSNSCYFDKSMICYDGESPIISETAADFTGDYPDTYMSTGTFSIVLPLIRKQQKIDLLDITIGEFITKLENEEYEEEFMTNLTESIFNSGEYDALVNYCFPVDNINYFLSLYGIQKVFYQNTEAQQALQQSKDFFKRAMDITANAKKFDYLG